MQLAGKAAIVTPGIIDTPIWGKLPQAAARGTNAPIDPHERARGAGHRQRRALPRL